MLGLSCDWDTLNSSLREGSNTITVKPLFTKPLHNEHPDITIGVYRLSNCRRDGGLMVSMQDSRSKDWVQGLAGIITCCVLG